MSNRSRAHPWWRPPVHLVLDLAGGPDPWVYGSFPTCACGRAVRPPHSESFDLRNVRCVDCLLALEQLELLQLVDVKWSLGEVRVIVSRLAFPTSPVSPCVHDWRLIGKVFKYHPPTSRIAEAPPLRPAEVRMVEECRLCGAEREPWRQEVTWRDEWGNTFPPPRPHSQGLAADFNVIDELADMPDTEALLIAGKERIRITNLQQPTLEITARRSGKSEMTRRWLQAITDVELKAAMVAPPAPLLVHLPKPSRVPEQLQHRPGRRRRD